MAITIQNADRPSQWFDRDKIVVSLQVLVEVPGDAVSREELANSIRAALTSPPAVDQKILNETSAMLELDKILAEYKKSGPPDAQPQPQA